MKKSAAKSSPGDGEQAATICLAATDSVQPELVKDGRIVDTGHAVQRVDDKFVPRRAVSGVGRVTSMHHDLDVPQRATEA
jgi:hypothetical protein